MDINFLGGTQEQQNLYMAALGLLMHFPVDEIDISVDVDFVADPSPGLHNEFAYSGGESGTGYSNIKNDAPGFASLDPSGQRYGMPFFNEVVAHELAHIILGNLPLENQEAIAAMFGTTVATWAPDGAWEDRPLEGICETFKDAFLPNRFRTYFNRTNHKLPIADYPEFRSLWRLSEQLPPDPVEFLVPINEDPGESDAWRNNGNTTLHINYSLPEHADTWHSVSNISASVTIPPNVTLRYTLDYPAGNVDEMTIVDIFSAEDFILTGVTTLTIDVIARTYVVDNDGFGPYCPVVSVIFDEDSFSVAAVYPPTSLTYQYTGSEWTASGTGDVWRAIMVMLGEIGGPGWDMEVPTGIVTPTDAQSGFHPKDRQITGIAV